MNSSSRLDSHRRIEWRFTVTRRVTYSRQRRRRCGIARCENEVLYKWPNYLKLHRYARRWDISMHFPRNCSMQMLTLWLMIFLVQQMCEWVLSVWIIITLVAIPNLVWRCHVLVYIVRRMFVNMFAKRSSYILSLLVVLLTRAYCSYYIMF